jgi:hypothetical protein
MSKVYSFRLNSDNPREAQAREVIESWVNDGYSLRYVVTEALLNNLEYKIKLEDIYSLVEKLKNMISGGEITRSIVIDKEFNGLSPTFTTSVKNSVRPGLKPK